MNYYTYILLAISLAMDAFSVCITSGAVIKKPSFRQYFRLSFHFALFQFLMPILGFYGGVFFEGLLEKYDHWVAFLLLLFIGGKMFWESFQSELDEEKRDPSRGKTLILLSISTSIDAAAVGFSMAALKEPIFVPSIIIGLICLVFSSLGVFIGAKIGRLFGKWAERFGGLVLILIGTRILVQHLS